MKRWLGLARFADAAARYWAALRYPSAVLYLVAAAFITSFVGVAVGNRYFLLILDSAAILPLWLWAGGRGRLQTTAWVFLGWGIAKAAAVAVMTVLLPERAAGAVLYGPAYAASMWRWLAGWELPSAYAPTPPIPWVAVVALGAASLLTAGIGGGVVAAATANCQGYYIGTLLSRGAESWRVVAFGWTPWAAFAALGLLNLWLATAEPLLSLISRRPLLIKQARDAAFAALLTFATAFVALVTLDSLWRDALGPSLLFSGGDSP